MKSTFNVFGHHRSNLEKLINEHWQKEFNDFNERFYLPTLSIEDKFDFSKEEDFAKFINVAALYPDFRAHPFYLLVQLQHSLFNS